MTGVRWIFILFFLTGKLFGQSVGDFRSFQSGDWNNVNTWERFDGAFWVNPAPGTPTNADGIVTLRNSHIVTVTANVTVDQIEYENDFSGLTGSLVVASGVVLTVANGAGDDIRLLNDFTTFALLQVDGTLSLTSGASIVDDDYGNLGIGPGPVTSDTYKIRNGGVHIHNVGAAPDIVPAGDWQDGSTCRINITSSNTPSMSPSISFYDLIWDGSAQTTIIDLNSTLTTIRRDFTVISTNAQILRLVQSANNTTVNIGRDFIIQGNSKVQVSTTANPVVLNIGRNFNISSSNSTTNAISLNSTGVVTINITGDFIKSGNSPVSLIAATTGSTSLNIEGNFSHTGGTITRSASVVSGSATINFTGNSSNSFTNSATITNQINFTVASAKSLALGTSAITGSGSLVCDGTISVGSVDPSGAIQSPPTTSGNIQISGTRTFGAGSTLIYNGTGAQVTGNGLSAASNSNITITNSSGVTMNGALTIGTARTLMLSSGSFLSIGANTLTIDGDISGTGSLVGGATSNLAINGTSSLSANLLFTTATQLNNFTLNRTSTGSVTLGSSLTITGTLEQTAGDLNLNGNTLTVSSIYNRSGGSLGVTNTSTLIVNGSGTLPSSVSFTGAALGTLTLNRASSTLTTSSNIAITNLNLTSGTFNNTGTITMASGGTITRTDLGSMSSAPQATTSYHVLYNIEGPTNSGVELPAGTTQLNNLTKDGSATLTLAGSITINGVLTLTNGIFDAASNTIDLKNNFVSNAVSQLTSGTVVFSGTSVLSGGTSPTFGNVTVTGTCTPSISYGINGNLVNNGTLGQQSVTFGGTTAISGSSASSFSDVTISGTLTAPSGSMNVAGNFINNGTFTHNGGTVVFNGTTSISGSSSSNFSSITVSGTLNSPATLNVAGDFTNNGTFNRNTGTVVFNGSSVQTIQGSTTTEFNNITVTNTGGPPSVRVQSNQDLRGVLTLSAGSVFDADGSSNTSVFTLRSTDDEPTADAGIATLPTGASVAGNVRYERFMSIEGANNNRIYRYISSPVQNATVADLQNEIPVTGTFTGTSSCSGCTSNQSMWTYDESNITGDLNNGYVDFPATANTEPFQPGVGYLLFVRGNLLGTPIWNLSGPINSGNADLGVTFTSSGTPANDGWNLVGNPYPSTIDWNSGSWTKNGLTGTIYMRDNGNGGVVATWNGTTGVNGGSRFIAAGQAFWVQADTDSPDLIATEAVKVAGTSTTFFRERSVQDLVRVTLVQNEKRDETVIHFREDANHGFDKVDAWKLKNSAVFNISSLTEQGEDLAINSLPYIGCSKTITLNMTNVTTGNYRLEFSELESFSNASAIMLTDKFTGTSLDVKSDSSYNFSITTDTVSSAPDRFKLVFSEFNQDFSLSVSDICTGGDAFIEIPESKSGAVYSVLSEGNPIVNEIAGNGNKLILNIPEGDLRTGQNDFIVRSYLATCNTAVIEKTVSFKIFEKPEILTVWSSQSCLEGSVTIEASGAPENGEYRWYETEFSVNAIAGQTSGTFTTPILQKPRTYFVSAVNFLGCEGDRKSVVAVINNYDPVLITTMEESGRLRSSYQEGNQWYKENELIGGATGQEFMPLEAGEYKVEVLLESGCLTTAKINYSGTKEQEVTGNGEDVKSEITVFPIPVKNLLNVRATMDYGGSVIVNSMGQEIGVLRFEKDGTAFKGQFDMTSKPSGLYFLKVVLKSGKTVHYSVLKN